MICLTEHEFQRSAWRSIPPRASDSEYGVGNDTVHRTISGSWRASDFGYIVQREMTERNDTISEWSSEIWE